MTVFVKQALVIDPHSPHNGTRKDILVENGIITRMGNGLNAGNATIIDGVGACISPGWVDIFCQFGDPGLEHKETLETGAAAAAAGGFTDVLLIPNTSPVIHNKTTVEYINSKNRNLPVTLHIIGAVTENTEGQELAEMIDMHYGGAIAFSDGINSIQSAGLLLKALQYVNTFNGVIIQMPDDKSISRNGLINEGVVSTRLGLPGKPALAEELMLIRDMELCAYAGSRIHFTGISTKESVKRLREAKAQNPVISCSVTPYHLYFTDNDLESYNTSLKVNPPVRTPADRDALIQALNDGVIDCVTSHHQPHEWDAKQCEFEYAAWGMEGLETCFNVLATVPGITAEKVTALLSIGPRTIFHMPAPVIKEGEPCRATVFTMEGETAFGEENILSRSKNNAFIGKKLRGRVLATICNQQITIPNGS
jgi:dihydroorotase